MTRAVLFDVDGTLIDTVDFHAEAWSRTFRHFGLDIPPDKVRPLIGMGGDNLLPRLVPSDLLAEKRPAMEEWRKDLFARDYMPRVHAFSDVRPLFERVRAAGSKIALASSGNADEVERYKDIADVGDLLDAQTTSTDVEHSKPDPDIFQAALAKLAPIRADEAVVVGDTPYDAEAAVKAGIRPVGVLCGGFPEADLRRAGCVAIFRDPADLLARFDMSPLAPGWTG
jgi:HAD superfamily hydrolase (TIGR01509 family)